MQFTGHSLPVHQFVTVPWDFNPVPYCQPSSPTPMEYALPPSLEWHVWPDRRSIYYTYSDLFLSNLFNYQFSYCIHLYTWSTQQVIVAQHMCCSLRCLILQCSVLSIISTLSHKGRWLPFSFHIWSAIPDFSISPVLLALLLMGDQSHLCIFYHNCKGWSKHSSWSY